MCKEVSFMPSDRGMRSLVRDLESEVSSWKIVDGGSINEHSETKEIQSPKKVKKFLLVKRTAVVAVPKKVLGGGFLGKGMKNGQGSKNGQVKVKVKKVLKLKSKSGRK